MADMEFNLLEEPWILVMRPNGETEEISLLKLFSHAAQYERLAGELPTQDVATLRLLLAIIHSVAARYDLDGSFNPIENPTQALERWKALWELKSFPCNWIDAYLETFRDRFFLHHPERPFWQSAGMKAGTEYPVAKLIGTISESSNKVRLFPQRTGEAKKNITNAEAARWLLHVNGFDDTSSKPTQKGLPSVGAGWLGKLGLVYASGDNLFETLCLNLVLLPNGGSILWRSECPVWELDQPKCGERVAIPMPENPSELYTLQSRRLLLKRSSSGIEGYLLMGGEFFPKENAFSEQMTVWHYGKSTEDPDAKYRPSRHDPSRRLWRDFAALVAQETERKRPGIVDWIAVLRESGSLDGRHIQFCTASMHYGDKDFFVDDMFSDSIRMNASMLSAKSKDWRDRIVTELGLTQRLVRQLAFLAESLAISSGSRQPDDLNGRKAKAMELGYHRLDQLFPNWLAQLDPDTDKLEDACEVWWLQSQQAIREIGSDLVRQAGVKAIIGRTIKLESKGNGGKKSSKVKTTTAEPTERFYSAATAYNRFLAMTKNRAILSKGERHD